MNWPGSWRGSWRARYRQRLDAALAELHAARLGCRSPLYLAARALRLPVRPPHYLGLIGATLHYALVVMPLVGIALWLLVWRHDDVRPMSLVSPVLQIGALPSLGMASLTWLVARWKKLSRWHDLGDGAPVAGLTS